MKRTTSTALLTGALLLASSSLRAEPPNAVTVALAADRKEIQPGKEFVLLIRFHVPEGSHFYSDRVDKLGVPTKIEVKGPAGYAFDKPVFPPTAVEKTVVGSVSCYLHDAQVPVRAHAPADAAVGQKAKFSVNARYQYCDESKCYPPKSHALEIELPVVDAAAVVHVDPAVDGRLNDLNLSTTAQASGDLWQTLGLAFVAGVILNVMPCVLPVIAIKVLSFVQHAGESRGRILMVHSVYAAGVVAVFLSLATLAVAARENSELVARLFGIREFSWGQQFQSKEFTLAMSCLVFAMGLSLLGVFEIPLPGFIGAAASRSERDGLLGVFLGGAMTTLLATPCTGPFLSPVIVWSLGQSVAVTYLVWAVIGLGMASPYVILGLFPAAVRLLPKPGAWMATFKQVAGFIMLATVIFLLNSMKERESMVRALFLFLGVGFALWLVGSHINVLTSVGKAWRMRALAVAACIAVTFIPNLLFARKVLPWQPFSEALFTQLVKEGRPVLIDFTADWCLNCKVNERLAIETNATAALVRERGITPLLADCTNDSPELFKWIKKFGSEGIPLTVVVPAGDAAKAQILDGPFTQATLSQAIDKAVPNAVAPKPALDVSVN